MSVVVVFGDTYLIDDLHREGLYPTRLVRFARRHGLFLLIKG